MVVAVGPGNQPCIPHIPGISTPNPVTNIHPDDLASPPPQVSHAMQLKTFPSESVKRKIAAGLQTNILIVGGGLTSAQLADLAVRHGVGTIWRKSGLSILFFVLCFPPPVRLLVRLPASD